MRVQQFINWLMPKERHFYDLLDACAACAREAGVTLASCCGPVTLEVRLQTVERLRDIEHKSDFAVAEVYKALDRTFVTPIDRGDIHGLAHALEQVVDDCCATAVQILVHAMEDVPPGGQELSQLVEMACSRLADAVPRLRDLKDTEHIYRACGGVKALEEEGDRIFRERTAAMFREEKDPIRLLKHKEFLESLENTLDTCDRVGKVIRTIVIKNS